MVGRQLDTHRGNDDHAVVHDIADQKVEQIERGKVGPVQILHDQRGGSA